MRAALVISTALPGCGDAVATAAAVAVAAASIETVERRGGVIVSELGGERRRGPTMLASAGARRLEESLRADGTIAAARGTLCWTHPDGGAGAGGDDDPLAGLRALVRRLEGEAGAVVVCLPAQLWRPTLEDEALRVSGGLLVASLPAQRPLAALAVRELGAAGARAKVVARPPGAVAGRRAIAGLDPGGATAARARRLASALLGPRPERPLAPLGERAQALPLVLGGALATVFCALLLVAIGGAVTGKARAQRIADLAAISAARSMRDDYGRLFAAARLSDGRPNPRHLAHREYLDRAAAAAREAAERNRADASRIRVSFPDGRSFAPLRVRVEIVATVSPAESLERGARPGPGPAGRRHSERRPRSGLAPRERAPLRPSERAAARPTAVEVESVAEAALSPPAEAGEMLAGGPRDVSGDEYAGPLAYRQGKPMRPDVARAFDQLAAAARSAGILLTITSAYRSNAEQAVLFARNPDPRWVAPPGKSLHRCGTELDLGPASAYGWLAANAPRFGFLRRYSWEPWHFGFTRGPAPCSEAANRAGRNVGGGGGSGGGVGGSGGAAGGSAGGSGGAAGGSTGGAGNSAGGAAGRATGDGRSAAASLPDYVPARFRAPIARAAARHDVSAALLAAQLLAESNFNPFAVSHAGAQGIAQFMPGTAAAYGLRDPFDPPAAIDAQARLMSDLLDQFGSVALALAAYNAGPAPVSACSCVPPYPETQAYVAKILGLLDGAGELAVPPLEVRLVE